MAKIEGACREVIEKAEWVAIATAGPDGPHLVGTWGDYIRALGIGGDGVFLVPVGGMARVVGGNGPGKRCPVRGRGQLLTTGDLADAARKSFPWARGVLVLRADEVDELLWIDRRERCRGLWRLRLRLSPYSVVNTSSAISASSSCIAGMACE